MVAITVGELKKILENVPDDYICGISAEGMYHTTVVVNDSEKYVDISY